MRKNACDLLEIKRMFEEETSALRFSLENLRAKSESELREKQVRIKQLEKAYSENNEFKNDETTKLKHKIKELEMMSI